MANIFCKQSYLLHILGKLFNFTFVSSIKWEQKQYLSPRIVLRFVCIITYKTYNLVHDNKQLINITNIITICTHLQLVHMRIISKNGIKLCYVVIFLHSEI